MRRVIIDTDPGKDDAVAILLALASPELDVLALSTVAGNVPVAVTTANALRIAALAGRADLPVYPGCARPLLRPPVTAEHVHGETGLGTLDLPAPHAAAQPAHAVDYLTDTLRAANAGTITLCVLGPATNVAMALLKAPDIAGRIAEVVWMAGAQREGGNVTPAAEFNAFADPHAAQVLLRSGVPLTLVPLDLTHQVQWTRPRLDALRALGTAAGTAAAALFSDPSGNPVAEPAGCPLHDPCVVAWLLAPRLFGGSRMNVEVEVASPLTLGATVVDRFGVTGRAPNALWLDQVDADGVFGLLTERLASCPPVGQRPAPG